MSENNPFLSKKSSNSRFSKDIFFQDEKTKPQEKRKNVEHTNVNTFLVDNDKNTRTINNTRKNDQRKNNDRKQMFFSQPKEPKPVATFDIMNEDFPELSPSASSVTNTFDQQLEVGKNFIDIVNTVNIVQEDTDKIYPGWIIISRDNTDNKIKITEGELTKYQLKKKETSMIEENLDFIMEQVHQELCKIWDKNIALYDSIHGEGAYQEVYYLPPVYDDFYKYDDCETEDEDNFDGNDLDDYSDRGWASDYE